LNNEKVLGGLKRYMELLPKDKEAAMDALMSARAQAGDGITAMKMRAGNFKGAYEHEQTRLEAMTKQEQEVAKLKATAEQHRQTLAQRERLAKAAQAHAERMAEMKGSGKASQQQFIAQRAVTALRGAASTMETVMKLPAGSTAGVLPFLPTKEGMFNFVKNAGGRTLSKEEQKAVETLYSGMSRYLATIEASGTATGLVGLAIWIASKTANRCCKRAN
jgi:hypothetical protein